MLGFLRRHGSSRSALGAAVTAIPSAPAQRTAVVPQPPSAAAASHRVELGFRDGTSTVLEPASTQAQALLELADLLSTRGAPSGSSNDRLRPTSSE